MWPFSIIGILPDLKHWCFSPLDPLVFSTGSMSTTECSDALAIWYVYLRNFRDFIGLCGEY